MRSGRPQSESRRVRESRPRPNQPPRHDAVEVARESRDRQFHVEFEGVPDEFLHGLPQVAEVAREFRLQAGSPAVARRRKLGAEPRDRALIVLDRERGVVAEHPVGEFRLLGLQAERVREVLASAGHRRVVLVGQLAV